MFPQIFKILQYCLTTNDTVWHQTTCSYYSLCALKIFLQSYGEALSSTLTCWKAIPCVVRAIDMDVKHSANLVVREIGWNSITTAAKVLELFWFLFRVAFKTAFLSEKVLPAAETTVSWHSMPHTYPCNLCGIHNSRSTKQNYLGFT